ncbi:DUF2946 domain-containing protein [Noviherbaspirillum aridicola]|uniref:Lipoprotein n=1 Tax=Noviherbaspirillum aridicola TaxID=2849687 RepID=A0ABQ4Q413_9BURK|nr:lipoprotein [Noviherbaspirillum aridicola]
MACVAILLVVLAPSISHALAAKKATTQEWTEICTSTGVKQVKVTDGESGKPFSPGKHDQHSEDCPFCRTHANTIGPPPTSAAIVFIPAASQSYPSLFYQAPRPQFTWAPAQSRAPPLAS